jgi:hypothetical protein
MEVSYPENANPRDLWEAEPRTDPILGWEEQEDFKLFSRWFEAERTTLPTPAQRLRSTYPFEIYARLQETPLSNVRGTAFRAMYMHSFGAVVMVRAMQQGTAGVLVVKVLNRRFPLSWMSTRPLTDDEWRRIENAARGLSRGTSLHEYFAKELMPKDCYQEDGAHIRVERSDGNETRVSGGTYSFDSTSPRQPSACSWDALDESRFLDYLLTFIPCCSGTSAECPGK